MKRFVTILATTLISGSAFCEVLTPEAALSRALSTSSSARHIKSSTEAPTLVKTINAGNQPAVYLFNRGTSGSLILSADDATEALLGVCDEGTIDVANMPPAMTAWLNEYANQIAYLRTNGKNLKNVARAAAVEREAIAPKCQTLWEQGSPYNNECPEVTSGSSVVACPTGCVATCLAQILKTFNYPEKGEGTYSYTWNNQLLSFDFDNNPFSWGDMLDRYKGVSADDNGAAVDAVAQLMYACGVVVDMNYKSGGSGAYPINLLGTGPKYLKLDKGIRYFNRDYYTLTEWNNMVYDALKNAGPLMYNGTAINSSTYAHEFVVDGYLSDDLFHINWGWGKQVDSDGYELTYNGYYRLTALDYESAGMNTSSYCYNYYQDIVCYIQPPVDGSTVFEQMCCGDNFVINTASANLGGNITLSGGLKNYSGAAVSGVAGIKICDMNGGLVCYAGDTNFSNLAIASNLGTYRVALPSELADGTYVVTPAFKVEGSEWKDVRTKSTGVQSYNMVVADGKCTFTANGTSTIEVSDFALKTPLYTSSRFKVTAKIKNTGNTEYSGKVAVSLIAKNSTGTRRQVVTTSYYQPLYVAAGETVDLDYINYFSDGSADTNYEVVLVDGSGNYLTDYVECTMLSGTPTYHLTCENPVIANQNDVDKYLVSGSIEVDCVSGFYGSLLRVWIYPCTEAGKTTSTIATEAFDTDVFTAVEGEKVVLPFHGEMGYGEDNQYYVAFVRTTVQDDDWLKTSAGKYTKTVFRLGVSSGVDDVATDSEVVSTEYFNLQGLSVGSHLTTPGLYIKVENLADGSKKTTKCIFR